jgi:drug/metabolite transporter, DME family
VSNPRLRGSLAVMAAAALFGTSATSRALADLDVDSTLVAALRMVVGGGGLFAIAVWRFGMSTIVRLWRRPPVVLMAVAVAAYQALFFIATGLTGVAIGTLASLALAPFAAGLLGWVTGAGAPGRLWAMSTALAVLGLVLLTGGGGTVVPLGVLAAFGAGAAYACYTVLGSRLVRDAIPPGALMGATFSLGALMLLPWLDAGDLGVLFTPKGLLFAAWLGLAATTVAYLFFGIGLKHLPPGSIATLNLFEPVVATALGLLLLREGMGVLGLLGCAIIVGALALLGIGGSRAEKHTLHEAQT